MLDTVVISRDDACCSVVLDTLVGVFVFNVMWLELLMTSAISVLSFKKWNVRSHLRCCMFVMYCMQSCISVSAVL